MPMFDFSANLVGRIVEATGEFCNMIMEQGQECSNYDSLTVNDALPMVRVCNTAKSKKVYGVISGEEDEERSFGGNVKSVYSKAKGDKRLHVNGLGEGCIWVSDANGPLENGDYIVSWKDGYGQKQNDDILRNYTVAKITMDCDFNPPLETCLLYTSPSPRDKRQSRMPSSA